MSSTLKSIMKHWRAELGEKSQCIDLPFNVEEFCRETDAKMNKLKALILLVDPAVSDQHMNELSAKQWYAYIDAFPEEKD